MAARETTVFVSLYPATSIFPSKKLAVLAGMTDQKALWILCACSHLCESIFLPMLNSPLSTRFSNEQEQQSLEESLQSPVKQRELVNQEKNLAVNLQHHVTVSQMGYEPRQGGSNWVQAVGCSSTLELCLLWALPMSNTPSHHQGNNTSEYCAGPEKKNFPLGNSMIDIQCVCRTVFFLLPSEFSGLFQDGFP